MQLASRDAKYILLLSKTLKVHLYNYRQTYRERYHKIHVNIPAEYSVYLLRKQKTNDHSIFKFSEVTAGTNRRSLAIAFANSHQPSEI